MMQVVEFLCRSIPHALPLDRVIEVAARVRELPLGTATGPVQSYIRYRGRPVPLVDLRERLNREPAQPTIHDHLILARLRSQVERGSHRVVALAVDRVLGLMQVDALELRPVIAEVQAVAGLAQTPDGLVILIDLDQLLSLEEEREVMDALAGADG